VGQAVAVPNEDAFAADLDMGRDRDLGTAVEPEKVYPFVHIRRLGGTG
jgi:hypothetical protein